MASMQQIFVALCERVLVDQRYQLDADGLVERGFERSGKHKERVFLVDVNWTHREMVYRRLLYSWVPTMADKPFVQDAERILMVSGTVEPEDIEWAKSKFDITVWERGKLLNLASQKTESLFKEYFKLMELYGSKSADEIEKAAIGLSLKVKLNIRDPKYASDLWKTLKELPKGPDTSADYENLCEIIINFIFKDALSDGRRQTYTEDNLSVLDLVYQIGVDNESEVWRRLANDFRCRVFVFECKNYSRSIGPMQLYTTERYLSAYALRTVGFLLTRHAPSKKVTAAAHAMLRETGKLIIVLSDADLKEMLNQRRRQLQCERGSVGWRGHDPSNYINMKIYNFLASMPR